MATNNAIDTAYLESLANKQASVLDNVLAQQTETLDQLVNRKKEDLGLKSEEKTKDFISQNISIDDITDADTLAKLGRLYGGEGNLSFDAYETAKYDPLTKALLPYLGSIEPTDGSKRSKKWNLHRKAYAKMHGIRDYTMVSQRMLNEEATKQTEAFKTALLKGQEGKDTISVDIRQDGEGYFGRPLITVRNPITGEIINEVMNTADNNAMFYSKYNKDAYIDGVLKLEEATTNYNERKYGGEGFFVSAAKGLSQGVNGLQATGWGMSALIADAIGGKRGEAAASWFIEQYLRNLEEAQARGAQLPSVENVDWSDPNEALSKFGALLGEAMPSIALMIGTGGLAGLIAKATQAGAKAGAKRLVKNRVGDKAANVIARSRAAGAYGAAMVMETGSIYGDVAAAGERDWKAIGSSLAGGTIAGALEAFYPVRLMRKLGMKTSAKKALDKTMDKVVLRNNLGDNFINVGKGILTGGSQEGLTEMLQFVVEEVVQDMVKHGHLPDFNSAEFRSGLLNSFVAGLVPGATLSGTASTVSEVMNRVRGDVGATTLAINQSQQEVSQAVNEAYGAELDEQSEKVVIDTVRNIEAQVADLGITLPEDYNTQNPLQQALTIENLLNQAEIEQKALPKGERNANILNARNTLNEALNQVDTGDAAIDVAQRKRRIFNNRDRQIERIKAEFKAKIAGTKDKSEKKAFRVEQKRQIAKKEQEATNKIKREILPKARGAERRGSEPARRDIVNAAKRIRDITTKLKNPNLSKSEIRKLKRERNQWGMFIENSVKTPGLTQGVLKQADKALKSFEYKYKRSKVESDIPLSEEVKEAKDNLATKAATLIETLEDEKSTPKQRANAIAAFLTDYKGLQNARDRLEVHIRDTNEPKQRKLLEKSLKGVEQALKAFEKEYDTAVKTKFKKPSTEASETDVLYSMMPFDKKSLNKLTKLEKQLSPEEKELLAAHKILYEANQELNKLKKDATKKIEDVRNDVLMGDEDFLGFLFYLEGANEGKDVLGDVTYFLKSLKEKLAAFNEAKSKLSKTQEKVWIRKEDKELVYEEPKRTDKDGNEVENLKDYWWVSPASTKLMTYIEAEIAFGEAVSNIIKTNNDVAPGRAEQIKEDEALREVIDLTEGLKEKTKPSEGDVDEIVVKKTKKEEDTEPEVEEVIEEEVAEEEEVKLTGHQRYVAKLVNLIKKAEKELRYYIGDGKSGVETTSFIKQLRKKITDLNENLKEARANERHVLNHIANKFQNAFIKIKDSTLKASDIFTIAQPNRKSIYSINPETSLIDDKGKSRIPALLKELGITDKAFIKYLDKYFLEFKNNFEEHILKDEKIKEGTELFTQRELLNLLAINVNGVKKIPDEVIFAMMMSTLDWMSINQFNSEVTTKEAIALMLYGDRRHAITNEELRTFGDMGITWRHASSEIGTDIFNNLNLKIDSAVIKGLKLDELLKHFGETAKEEGTGVIKDDYLKQQLQIALGGMSLVIASTVHPRQKTKDGKPNPHALDGLVEILYTDFHHESFSLKKVRDKKGEPIKVKNKKTGKMEFLLERKRLMKTIKFPYLERENIKRDKHGIRQLIDSFKDNKENIKTINGTISRRAEPLDKASKTIQQFVRDSFVELPQKVKDLIKKLQNVEWSGKKEALELFELVDSTTMNILTGKHSVDEKNINRTDHYKNSNKDKDNDIEQVREYLKQTKKGKLKSFWFRYAANKSHRIRIDSNGINGQRSKIHRALFMPISAEVTVDSDFHRAVFKLGVLQALGYPIDKRTLKQSEAAFDAVVKASEGIVTNIKEGNKDDIQFNKLLNKLLQKDITIKGQPKFKVGASMHVLEGLASLAKYDPNNSFKTAKLGIETDGITNGYAIALIQFLGVPQDILNMPQTTADEIIDREIAIRESLTESLARTGVMIGSRQEGGMEAFIEGNNLDVYEALAKFVGDALIEEGAIEKINDKKEDWEPVIDEQHLRVLNTIHGNIWNETRDAISKFGRNLAKNPLMISGYGAEVKRIITALAEDVVPEIYDKLAEFQVAHDNAKNKKERDAIAEQVKEYAEALDVFLPYKANKVGVRILKLFKAGKLKEFTFLERKGRNEVRDIKNSFKAIFRPAITTALDQFTRPLKKARDAIIKSGEIQYISFRLEYDAAIEKFKKDEKVTIVPLSVKKGIAENLAVKLMPMVYGPWSDENTLLQLIKEERTENLEGRIDISFKKKTFTVWSKKDSAFNNNYQSDRNYITSYAFPRSYTTPGVSMYTNTIQNIDSVLLGEAMDKNPEVLAIYDALMSNITDAVGNVDNYNEALREVGVNFSILDRALERLLSVKGELGNNVNKVNTIYREGLKDKDGKWIYMPSFEARALQDRIDTATTDASKDALQAELDALSFDTIETEFNDEINRIAEMNEILGHDWLLDAIISQMYIPESLKELDGYEDKRTKVTRTRKIKKVAKKVVKKVAKKVVEPKEKEVEIQTGLVGTRISAEILAGFKGAKDAATKLANSENQTAYVRKIAKLIIPLLSDDIKVSTDFDLYTKIDGEIRSHFDPGTEGRPPAIVFNPNDSSATLLHELIHAATQVILNTPSNERTARQNNAVKQLHKVRESILKQYEKDIAGKGDITKAEEESIHYLLYGDKSIPTNIRLARKNMNLGNFEGLYDNEALAEFLTQVLTHPDAQSYLKRKLVGRKTIWNKLVTSVRNLLNISNAEVDTLLDDALSVTLETIQALIEPTPAEAEVATKPEELPDIVEEIEAVEEEEIVKEEKTDEETIDFEPIGDVEGESLTPGQPYELNFINKETGKPAETNGSQTIAITKMKDWWDSGQKVFVLAGRGGTGKTTIVDRAIQELGGLRSSQVKFALPTHKAKTVIKNAAKRYSSEQFDTIAAMLGHKKKGFNADATPNFEADPKKASKAFEKLDEAQIKLIVIDEASMVGDKHTQDILDLAEQLGNDVRVLFMGDNVQLPPPMGDRSKITLSAVFANLMKLETPVKIELDDSNSHKLLERMRQKNESPILGFTDILANAVEYIFFKTLENRKWYSGKPNFKIKLPRVPESKKHEGIHYMPGEGMGTVAQDKFDKTLEAFADEYKKDPENVKYIWYFNAEHDKTKNLRARIRAKIFPNEEHNDDLIERPYIKDEQIVLGATTQVLDGSTAKSEPELHNGDTVVVTEEAKVRNLNFEVENDQGYTNKWDNIPVNIIKIKTLASEGTPKEYSLIIAHKDTEAAIRSQMTDAQANSRGDYIMKITLNSILSTEMAAGYLINVHKAQGSTYKTVYADYTNTLGAYGPGWLNAISSLYVATSRPTTRLVLVGNDNLEFGPGQQLTINKEIAEKLEEGKDLGKDEAQSLDDDVDTEAEKIWDTNSIRVTAQNIFNRLGNHMPNYYPNTREKDNQEAHLQRVLDQIIIPTGNALDNVTLELYASDLKAWGAAGLQGQKVKVHMNINAPGSFAEQTSQEVYLHELIHILTHSPLMNDPTFRENVRTIRNSIKKELEKMDRPYEMFLHKDEKGKIITLTNQAQEIAAAKKQYNYLFGDTMPPKYILDEFLAYALTNKHLVRQLSSMPANVVPLWNKESDAHVSEKILDLFTELLNRLFDMFNSKRRSRTLEQQIFNLTKEMVTVSHEKAGTIRQVINKQQFGKKYDDMNDVTSSFLKDMVSKGVKFGSDQYMKGVDKLTKDGKINNFLANVLYDSKLAVLMTSSYGKFINNNPRLQQHLDKAFQNLPHGLRHNMASLKADAFGGIPDDFIKLLYKSQMEVDVARKQYKQLTRESLLNEFKDLDSLTKNEKDAITRVLFKSDFSILEATGAYNMKRALSLLTDDKLLKQEITKYEHKILGIVDKNGAVINKHYFIQADQLAFYMMGGNVENHNQFKNAHVIHQKNTKKSKVTVENLDVYITLLALQKAEKHSKQEVANIVKREFKNDKEYTGHNGITNVIHHHIAFKENSRKEGFDDNPTLMTKGYFAKIVDPDIQIEFAPTDPETRAKMEANEYELISGFEKITGLHDMNYGIYVIQNLPDAMRAKGIASVTSKHHAGTSFREILSRNPRTEGQVNQLLKKWIESETEKENTLDKNHTMMPILNEKGKIVDYSIHMNHVMFERVLKQELAFDQVLSTMYSHQQDKVSSQKINREAIDLLQEHTTLNYDKAPQKYVNILDGKFREEFFYVLPTDTRNYIEKLAEKNRRRKGKKKGRPEFFVERKLLDVVFGYKMPSIANSVLFKSRITGDPHSFKAQRYAKVAEKMMFELVALSKVNIVIKIPMVFMFNVTSNFFTSMLYGIPPNYVIKKWREGFKELQRYQKDAEKLKLLELKQIGNPALKNSTKIKNQMKALTVELNRNKVSKLISMGLFNSITEDINRNDFTYRHKSLNTLRKSAIGRKFDNVFKGNVAKAANQAYMGEETATFKTMMHLTQASDFIARYAMYSYTTEVKGMPEAKAYKQMVETFVNYDQPLNKYLQYGNDIGLLFFVKYWVRIQRAAINLAKEKPLNIGLLFIANGMLDLDFESIFESSVLTGNFFPTEGGPLKVLGEVVIFPGLEILAGEGLAIG